MSRASVLSLFLLFFVTGCSATVKVQSSFNPNINFSGLQTYGWLHSMDKPGDDVRINNTFVIESIRAAVEKDLNSKGFTRVDGDKADFVITWFGAIEQQIKTENIDHFYRRYGYGALYRDPYWNTQPSIVNVKEYEEGSLIFDFLEPEKHTLLWRGIGRDKIKEGQSESQVKKNLNAAVSQILAGFPPP